MPLIAETCPQRSSSQGRAFCARREAVVILDGCGSEGHFFPHAVRSTLSEGRTVDTKWQEAFRNRMHRFQTRRAPAPGETAVSIKVRITSGCFHREHSPRAYELIDRSLDKLIAGDSGFAFEEHESGPEILMYLALTTAGIGLAKSVIDLIVAIIKARTEGIKKGDHPAHPLELIVRRVHNGNEFREETVLRIGHTDSLDEAKLEQQLKDALQKLLKDEQKTETKRGSRIKRRRKP